MPTTSLTRSFQFSASHRLHSDQLDAAANAATYGACENLHGHNYRLDVTVRGKVDPKTGFFCNVLDLADLVERLVIKHCDHQCLNEVPLFKGLVITMESLAARVWQVLEPELKKRGMQLTGLVLAETEQHWVTLTRD
jgi:6-pyruvoyltetrahydropterin/6-carboxytetrahydropterin synthase